MPISVGQVIVIKTAYCTKCRQHFEVTWTSPPYALRHHGDDQDEHPTHSNPVTGEPAGPAVDG